MKKNCQLFSFNIFLDYLASLRKISKYKRVPVSQLINTAIKDYIEAERDAEISRGKSKLGK